MALAGTADQLTNTGTAALGGTVTPNVLNLVPGAQRFAILTAAGGVTDNVLSHNSSFASPVVVGSLSFPNANDPKRQRHGAWHRRRHQPARRLSCASPCPF